jgi:hypothetical protein
MTNTKSIRILVAGLLLALLVSAALPVAAFADEGDPPTDPTPTELSPAATEEPVAEATPEPTEEPTGTGAEEQGSTGAETEVAGEPAPEQAAPSEEPTAELNPSSEEAVTVDETAEVLASIPEGTELILLDEQGETVSLASEEAAEMLAVVDPMWCPVGVTPGGAGCSIDYPDLATLVASFVPTGNGVIWIEAGPDSSGVAIVINGAGGWITAKTYTLELKGGWDGFVGSTATNSLTPSTFAQTINISNWEANVTLSDIAIDATGTGLTVATTKNIVLNRVNSSGNTIRGANLDNRGPGGIGGTGTITVNSSTFNSNGTGGGLLARSNSSITLSNITANSNTGAGAYGISLNNTTGTGNITISGVNTFNSNGSIGGISALSKGNISITGVTANLNATRGAYLENVTGTGTVTVTSSTFSSNGSTGGLNVVSKGSITLSSVTASSNTGGSNFGATLTNIAGTGNITISGTNTFNSNGNLGGLNIDTNGTISITGVTANLNNNYGADLDADGGAGTVTVKSSTFSSNTVGAGLSGGLKVSSKGSITLTGVTASSNLTLLGNGAYLDNTAGTGSIAVSSSTFDDDAAQGILAYSNGSITFTGVSVSTNDNGGAYLDNCDLVLGVCTSPGTGGVTVNTSTFNANAGNNGLSIYSHGTITLNSVTASGNTGSVAVGLDNHGAITAKNVALTGVNEFNLNWRWGLSIVSKGSVSVKDVTASENGQSGIDGDGVEINNTYGTSGVTFTGTNIFNHNRDSGLDILSNGAVKLNNIIANSNGNNGVYIFSSVASSVSFTGSSQLKFNDLDNLHIETLGSVTLTNIIANSSQTGNGVNVNNASGTTGVTITGTNTINNNYLTGLSITSAGAISLNNITANENGLLILDGYGAYLDNSADTTVTYSKVSITGTNTFNDNYFEGLLIKTNGTVSLNSVTANGAVDGRGADIQNTYGGFTGSKQPVTLTGTNSFSDNDKAGLYIKSYGAITINNVTAKGNGSLPDGIGVWLTNNLATTPMNVTISGTNNFSENYYGGLYVDSQGAVKINNLTANENGLPAYGYGAELGTSGAPLVGSVTLTGTNTFTGNFYTNLIVHTHGTVSLSNLTSSNSVSGHGVDINNTYGNCVLSLGLCTVLSPPSVTISGTNVFSTNHCSGLKVNSHGTITLNSSTATLNGTLLCGEGYGIYLDNDPGTLPKGVTVSGTNDAEGNYTYGLFVTSLGAIKVNSLTASNNGTTTGANGVYLANDIVGAVGGITLTGTNQFASNGGNGLGAYTYGAISINSLTATGNGAGGSGNGADLINNTVDDSSPQKVTLTGTNSFSDNASAGLYIYSKGALSLSNVTASGNLGGNGVTVTNTFGDFDVPQTVTISGTNIFNDNDDFGLIVTSYGAITLNSTTANGNGVGGFGYGVQLINKGSDLPQKVALTGTNSFTDNEDYGLYVWSKGAITSATKLTVNGNGDVGAYLDNDETGAVGAVTLSGSNTFSGNYYEGLSVFSRGAITVNNLTVENNGFTTGDGAELDNCDWNGSVCQILTQANVTLSGTVIVNGNDDYGVFVISGGAISLSNVTADANTAGLYLWNHTEGKGVTLSGTNLVTNSITGKGVEITSLGPVSINSLTSSGNGNAGLFIENQDAFGAQAVKLTGTNRFENNSYGFFITSKGTVTLNNMYASDNTNYGGYVNNTYGTANLNVILTGTNTFSENGSSGLSVTTDGSLTISNISADGNDTGDGLNVSSATTVTISCGRFTNNGDDGLDITASGTVTLKGVISSGNVGLDLNYAGTPVISRTC